MDGLETKVFDRLPDETWFYPGHGDDSVLPVPVGGGLADHDVLDHAGHLHRPSDLALRLQAYAGSGRSGQRRPQGVPSKSRRVGRRRPVPAWCRRTSRLAVAAASRARAPTPHRSRAAARSGRRRGPAGPARVRAPPRRPSARRPSGRTSSAGRGGPQGHARGETPTEAAQLVTVLVGGFERVGPVDRHVAHHAGGVSAVRGVTIATKPPVGRPRSATLTRAVRRTGEHGRGGEDSEDQRRRRGCWPRPPARPRTSGCWRRSRCRRTPTRTTSRTWSRGGGRQRTFQPPFNYRLKSLLGLPRWEQLRRRGDRPRLPPAPLRGALAREVSASSASSSPGCTPRGWTGPTRCGSATSSRAWRSGSGRCT